MIKLPVFLFNGIFVIIVRFLIRMFCVLFFRPKVFYTNKKVQKKRIGKPAVIICNHTYYIDAVLIGTLFFLDRIYSFAAKDLYTNIFKNWLMNSCRCIPLDRNEVDTKWMHKGVDVLRKGYPVCIFPEGVSNYDRVMSEFKPSFLLLAIRTNSPIIPMCIDGPYDFIFGQRQRILIGEPIHVIVPEGGITREFLKAESEKYFNIVADMQKELRAKYHKKLKVNR